MSFYVLDDNNNKQEALDKEGVLAVLAQAIQDGTINNIVADAAFVSKLKCCVTGGTNRVAFVTQQKYNELLAAGQLQNNTLYNIVDDPTAEELDAILQALSNSVNQLLINCSDNTYNINNIYTFLNKVTPQRLVVDSEINGIRLTKNGLYAFVYVDAASRIIGQTIMLSYVSNIIPFIDNEKLEVKTDGTGSYYVKAKNENDFILSYGYLITQY